MGKVIGNVGLLDLTTSSEESINEIEQIGNVGMLIYSRETARLASKINIMNLGASEEVPEDCKFISGQVEIDRNYFQNIKSPVSLLLAGQITIKQDVSKEDIENGIKYLSISGQVMCPEKLIGVLQSKCSKINGQLLPYSNNHFISTGKLNIDISFLKATENSVSLLLIGKMTMLDDIPEALFNEKVESINIIGKALVREEYLEMFKRKLRSGSNCKIQVVPRGYSYIADDLKLDTMSIKRFDHAKIYTVGMLQISGDITLELLKNHIEKIQTKDVIVCRKELKEPVFELCDDVTVQICDYSGKVYIIDGEHTLTQSELKYTPEDITYIVRGELTINDDVSPDLMFQKIEHIDNLGDIFCSGEQCGLVQVKLRTSQGDVISKDGHTGNSNMGYLKL